MVFLGGAAWQLVHLRWALAAGWATLAILSFLLFYATNYLQVLYRSNHDFHVLSRVYVLRALANLGFVGFVVLFRFYGLCLRAVGIGLVEGLLLWRWRPVRVRPRLVFADMKHLFLVGMPILVVGYVNAVWQTINCTMILETMGTRALGLYFAGWLAPALLLLPMAVQQITYPRITEMYGRGSSVRNLVAFLWKPTAALTAIMAVGVAVLWVILPTATRIFLPKYIEGVQAVRWASLDCLIVCLLNVRSVFFTVRKQHYYLIATFFGMSLNVVAVLILVRNGLCLEAFSQALVIGRLGQVVACHYFAHLLCKREALGSPLPS